MNQYNHVSPSSLPSSLSNRIIKHTGGYAADQVNSLTLEHMEQTYGDNLPTVMAFSGRTREQCLQALHVNDGNVERAVNFLLTEGVF